MWPQLVEAIEGGLAVNTYGLFILLAFVAAFLHVQGRAREMGIAPERLVPVYLAATFGGGIGARVLYTLAVDGPAALFSSSTMFSCAGFAYYGGVLGGGAGAIIMANVIGLPGWKVTDLLAPALVLGLGIGRFGCLFAGCCFGAVAPRSHAAHALLPDGLLKGQFWLDSASPWLTLEFAPGGVGSIFHQPLYPTQIWSALAGLGIAVGLTLLHKRRRFDGQIFATMLLVEPVFRVIIEAFRADQRGTVISWQVSERVAGMFPGMSSADGLAQMQGGLVTVGLTTSQTIGLSMILVGIGIYVVRRHAGVAPEIPLLEEE
jgi:phosphatidylglycerol:prolipoprotein diacylglycerol transferase